MMLTSAPRSVTDRRQRVLNTAARLVSGRCKYDSGLSQILHVDLHWLNMADRVRYKLAVTVHSTQQSAKIHGRLLRRSNIASRQQLCLAHRRQLDVPRHQHSTLGIFCCRTNPL